MLRFTLTIFALRRVYYNKILHKRDKTKYTAFIWKNNWPVKLHIEFFNFFFTLHMISKFRDLRLKCWELIAISEASFIWIKLYEVWPKTQMWSIYNNLPKISDFQWLKITSHTFTLKPQTMSVLAINYVIEEKLGDNLLRSNQTSQLKHT